MIGCQVPISAAALTLCSSISSPVTPPSATSLGSFPAGPGQCEHGLCVSVVVLARSSLAAANPGAHGEDSWRWW
jgi:hypothetical protein